MKKLLPIILLFFVVKSNAQIKVGDNPATINANSLLEMESTNKGFLPPRMALNSLTAVTPLTGTVPAGMLVFSTGGSLPDGYYYWDGVQWQKLATGDLKTVVKTANATLTKAETFVLASNDITITLPVVTAADNGLTITVKNNGTYTDLVTVQGSGGATIDAGTIAKLNRWVGQNFIVYNGNWLVSQKKPIAENLLDVNANSSWTTVSEVVAYLNLHMSGPTVVRLGETFYGIDQTIIVNLPYTLTFQGISFGVVTIGPVTGLVNKPMFRCLSECYFKMLSFDATTLANYGTLAGEDAIRFVGIGTYNEAKDCSFDRFYNTILDSTNAEIWIFECDISNAQKNGILLQSAVAGAVVKVAETDFISCRRGINLDKGSAATIQLSSGGYYNANATDTAIVYRPASFLSYTSISITGNSWNNTGKYVEGFDFARSDGRDANVIMESNAGVGDASPSCTINVLNSATTTTVTTANSWYKANWTNTASTTTKWTIANNKMTYQPNNRRNGWVIISGNLSCGNSNRTISIGIVKNGVTSTRYGETTLRTTATATPSQFSTVIYLADIAPGDYFELYCSSLNNGEVVTFQDILWLTNSR